MSIIKKDQKINIFLQVLAAETGASKNTLLAYEKDLVLADSHTQSIFEKNLSSANERELLSCLSRWQKQGKSAKTITRRISALKQMMKWLVSDGYRTDNPATWLDNPKLPQTIPVSLLETEIYSILEAAEKLSPPDNLRMSAGIEILYGAGLRISELLQVRRADIIFIKSLILVRGKGGRERLVPLTNISLIKIKNWLEKRDVAGPDTHHEQLLALPSEPVLTSAKIFYSFKKNCFNSTN